MAIFLSEVEGREFRRYCDQRADGARLRDALRRRVRSRLVGGGLGAGPEDWWFCVAEYVTDAAMVFALERDGEVGEWLRAVMLWLVDRPIEDWVGPAFREHGLAVPVGNLETAHLTWATGVALDLGHEAFSPSERERLLVALRERGAAMCGRWLSGHNHLANWRCVLLAGLSVAAVVLGDRPLVDRCVEEYELCLHVFQPDGSYGESLQYGNYAASAMMLTREALLRSGAVDAAAVTASPWSLMPRWQASSLLYQRPVEGWGVSTRAVSANFNDSAALFRPSGDLLLHIATRERERTPEMAGLARWLFDRMYGHDFEQAPHNRASFGFLNDFGFLSVPLLAGACSAMEPQEAGLTCVEAFSCGDVLLRDGWGGTTIVAVRGADDGLHGPGHLHGDMNSFILVHNDERLIVDPGHSCYRSLLRGLDTRTRSHSTCTFHVARADAGAIGGEGEDVLLEQSHVARRRFDWTSRLPGVPVDRGGRRLLAGQWGELVACGSEVSALYGWPMEEFSRFWFLCGSHALFVVDVIRSKVPVRAEWTWLLDQRDGKLEVSRGSGSDVMVRRGESAMLLHCGGGEALVAEHAFVHDAYDPLPGGPGEGRCGSGLRLSWRERSGAMDRVVLHGMAMDVPWRLDSWACAVAEGSLTLRCEALEQLWTIRCPAGDRENLELLDGKGGGWRIVLPRGAAGAAGAVRVDSFDAD